MTIHVRGRVQDDRRPHVIINRRTEAMAADPGMNDWESCAPSTPPSSGEFNNCGDNSTRALQAKRPSPKIHDMLARLCSPEDSLFAKLDVRGDSHFHYNSSLGLESDAATHRNCPPFIVVTHAAQPV